MLNVHTMLDTPRIVGHTLSQDMLAIIIVLQIVARKRKQAFIITSFSNQLKMNRVICFQNNVIEFDK